jgi:antirestriction protein
MNLNQSVTASLNAATAPASGAVVQGFFYIDGIPTKGLWIDLLPVRCWDNIAEQLQAAYPDSVVDEILISDCDSKLVRPFITTSCDAFSMDEWADFAESLESTHLSIEVIEAYCSNFFYPADCEMDKIEESYCGQFDSDEDFAVEMLDSTGDLDSIPEHLRYYFDYAAFARDLMYDYFEADGYYFRNL